ncbi:MAG: TetR family transcriptional regulator [Solirubrobacteraceae bacterium]|nr:TetR family transcriptional regulator [Solirubrobacteraceae bacterium]
MTGTASTAPAPEGRRYGGRTAEERRNERRDQLIEAGLEVFGTVGFAGTSIRAILRESGLAERYFYENFASLELLLVAVHAHVNDAVLKAVRAATNEAGADVEARARAGVRAFIETITTDPRWVRIKLQEIGGSAGEEVQKLRLAAQEAFAEVLIAYGPNEATLAKGLQPHALARAVISAIESLVDAWATGQLPVTLDSLIDHAVVIIKGTATELERVSA